MSNTEEELDKNKLAEAKNNLESFFADINTAKKSDFEEQEAAKTGGVSAGSIATKTKSGNKSVLKVVYKSNNEIQRDLEAVQENIKPIKALEQSKKATQKDLTDLKNYKDQQREIQQKSTDRGDFVREQVSSRLYKLLLHDDAHTVQLVTQEQDDKLYLSGKFFDDVELLTKFSGSDRPGEVESTSKLQKLKGVEKIFAACHIMGETDYHSDNLMVDGQNNLKKIDHGKSLLRDAKDFKSVVAIMYNDFNALGNYNQAIADGNLSFSAKNYSDALQQMLTQLTLDQMNNIVDQQIADLETHGFDPAGIEMVGTATITDFDNLKTIINERLKTNIAGMNDVAEKTNIIAQFDVDKTFKNGGWVAAFAESGGVDPVLFAINNNITISGKNPLLWASENQYKSANEDLSSKIDAFTKENNISPTKSNKELLDAIKTKNTPAIQSIIQKGADIHAADANGKTPLHYAIENGKIEVFNTLLDKGADIHAADANGKTPLHYALENGKIEIFNTLLNKGAKINAVDNNGKTALDQAIANKQWNIIHAALGQKNEVNPKTLETSIKILEAAISQNNPDNSNNAKNISNRKFKIFKNLLPAVTDLVNKSAQGNSTDKSQKIVSNVLIDELGKLLQDKGKLRYKVTSKGLSQEYTISTKQLEKIQDKLNQTNQPSTKLLDIVKKTNIVTKMRNYLSTSSSKSQTSANFTPSVIKKNKGSEHQL